MIEKYLEIAENNGFYFDTYYNFVKTNWNEIIFEFDTWNYLLSKNINLIETLTSKVFINSIIKEISLKKDSFNILTYRFSKEYKWNYDLNNEHDRKKLYFDFLAYQAKAISEKKLGFFIKELIIFIEK